MDMKQSITLVGFGAERFDCAVWGLGSIYQYFNCHVALPVLEAAFGSGPLVGMVQMRHSHLQIAI